MEETWENLYSSLGMHEELQCPMNLLDEDQLVQKEMDIVAGGGIQSKGYSHDSQKSVGPSSPSTYILSFDHKSTIPHDCFHNSSFGNVSAAALPMPSSSPPRKKFRTSSESLYHIMTERKRRQTITERFIALSAAIPGLKKMNKASVLEEAINYLKQLQNRVKELEEETAKTSADSLIVLKKSHWYVGEESTCRENKCADCCYRVSQALPEIEAIVFKNEVLIRIHCGTKEDILLKILSQMEVHNLTAPKSCVLPFGNTLGITIVAQKSESCRLKVKDLVKNLKLVLL